MAYLLHALIMHAVPVLLCIKKKKPQRESHVTRRDKTFSTGRNNRGSSATNPTLVRLHCVYGFQPKKKTQTHTKKRKKKKNSFESIQQFALAQISQSRESFLTKGRHKKHTQEGKKRVSNLIMGFDPPILQQLCLFHGFS